MTMIEVMARASHEFFRPIYNLPPFDDLPADAKSTIYQHCRTVLGAMEKPSPAIDAVSIMSINYGSDEVWQMFIKALLAEKPA